MSGAEYMTAGEAALLVVGFVFAISLILSVCLAVLTIKYEVEDRLRKRARRDYVEIPPSVESPPATIHPLRMARSRREQRRPDRPAA